MTGRRLYPCSSLQRSSPLPFSLPCFCPLTCVERLCFSLKHISILPGGSLPSQRAYVISCASTGQHRGPRSQSVTSLADVTFLRKEAHGGRLRIRREIRVQLPPYPPKEPSRIFYWLRSLFLRHLLLSFPLHSLHLPHHRLLRDCRSHRSRCHQVQMCLFLSV